LIFCICATLFEFVQYATLIKKFQYTTLIKIIQYTTLIKFIQYTTLFKVAKCKPKYAACQKNIQTQLEITNHYI